MTDTRVQIAARNNAEWCSAVCRAHGLDDAFSPELWITRGQTPRHYPNVITLSPEPEPALAVLESLAEPALPELSIKDSFATLELGTLGFRRLLQARWLWKAPPPTRAVAGGGRWTRVGTAGELLAWERAWSGSDDARGTVTFPAGLLQHDDIAFLKLEDGPDLVAGIIANRAAGAVGISNLFLRAGSPRVFSDALAAIGALYPGLPIVGYQPIDSLAQAQALGFELLDTLRVWVRG